MTATNIDIALHHLIDQLSAEQKSSLLAFVKTIIPPEQSVKSYTIQEYNQDLAEAEAEIERGEVFSHEEALAIFKQHLDGKK